MPSSAVQMPAGPSPTDLAARTHVFSIHDGDQAVCINPPVGYGPSAQVATVWPSANSWGPDAELIVLALRCAQLDELVGPLAGRTFFDASGTSGMLAVVASRYGADRSWVLAPRVLDGALAHPWLSRHYPRCQTTPDPSAASTCDAAVYNFYRYPEPACLAAVAHALPVGARLVVVGVLPAHLSTIEGVASETGLELVRSTMPWVDEMQLVTFVKRGPGQGEPASFALPDSIEASRARWAQFAASMRVQPDWRIDGVPKPAEPGEHAIAITPSLCYGSGGNEVTQIMLQTIGGLPKATWADDPAVLDLGCGTGILAIGCARRGARRITAMDICPQARAQASRNAELNGVDIDVVDEVPSDERYDLIVANLYGSIWPEYLPRLPQMLRPGGLVLSTGIPSHCHEPFAADLAEVGLDVVQVYRELAGQDVGWPCAVSRMGG